MSKTKYHTSIDSTPQRHAVAVPQRPRLPLLGSGILHALVVLALSLLTYPEDRISESVIVASFGNLPDSMKPISTLPELRPTEPVPASPAVTSVSTIWESSTPPASPRIAASLLRTAPASENTQAPSDVVTTNPEIQRTVNAIQGRVDQAGGRPGEVQFALAWQNVNDLDLHVIAPSGEQISYSHKQSFCRGRLDVDMNVKGESDEPVENIRWLKNDAPAGRYTVVVNLFQVHRRRRRFSDAASTDYQLLASLGGETSLVEQSIELSDRLRVHRFQYVSRNRGALRRQQLLSQLTQLQESEERQAEPLLSRALEISPGPTRDVQLREIVRRFPHTDAAIEALKLLGGDTSKPQ